jgi:Flp pilus assembly protein TadB
MATPQSSGADEQRIRASDAEREQVAHILQTAMTEGRLTLDEGEQRLAAVYAATYRDDLLPLTADLPDHGRYALAELPEARLAARRDRRRQAAVVTAVAVVAAVVVGLWVLSGAHVFWPAILIFFFVVRPLARGRHHHRHR